MATVRIQVRRGTSTDWSNVNPTLAAGEMGVETNTRKLKIGDGTTAWNSLEYIASDAPGIEEIAQDAINAALSMGSGLTKTYDDVANTITIAVDSSIIALKSYVDSEITATEGYADSAISTHNSDTTNVHGIANTADLATQDYVDAAVATLGNTVDTTFIPDSEKGMPNGVATLNASGFVPQNQINDTVFARITYVDQAATAAVAEAVGGSPELLNTLNELAAAIGNDPNYAATMTAELGTKVDKAGDTMTGNLSMPDPTSAAHAANKSYVDSEVSSARSDLNGSIITLDGNITTGLNSANNLIGGLDLRVGTLETDTSALSTTLTSLGNTVTSQGTDLTSAQGDINTINSTLLTMQSDISNAQNNAISTSESYTDGKISDEVSARNIAISSSISDHNNETLNVHGILNTANLATKNYADGAVSAHEADTTNIHGIADTAALATKTYADNAVSTHESDTTNVHGIADTSALATKTYADGKASDAQSAAISAAESTAAAALSSHEADTTNIHGIADTSALATKAGTETLTNKTINLTSNTLSGTKAQFNAALSDGDFATIAGTETLTNKTLTSPVVNSPTGIVKADVGLGNVDNTSDSDKPVSTATQTALDLKAPLASPTFTGTVTLPTGTVTSGMILDGTIVNADINASAAIAQSKISGLTSDLAAKAALAGATFTGDVTIPNLTLSGNLTVQGTTTTVSSTNLEVSDPLIYFGTGNSANANDLGMVGHFDNGTYQHTGIVRDATDGKWKVFSGVATEPTGTIDFTGATYDTFKAGTFEGNLTGNVTGNADTATKLATARNINGVSFDGSAAITVKASTTNALTIGTGLSGTSFDGSSAVTVAIDSTVATLSGTQTLTNKTLTSPTLTTPALGTPASGVMTNVTGLPLTSGVTGTLPVANGGTGITSLGSGVATWMGTPSSANLAAALTDETGSGALVFATSPTLVTPTLGAASATSITFSDGTQSKQGVPSLTTINAQSGTTYTTVLGDRDALIELNNASPITITIPLNSAVAYPVGTSIDILQVGAGQVTVNGTAGVTINATPQGTANTAKLRAQWSGATLFKRATDTWVVTGDLTA